MHCFSKGFRKVVDEIPGLEHDLNRVLAVETHFFMWQQKCKCSISLQRVQRSSSEFSERNRARCHRHQDALSTLRANSRQSATHGE